MFNFECWSIFLLSLSPVAHPLHPRVSGPCEGSAVPHTTKYRITLLKQYPWRLKSPERCHETDGRLNAVTKPISAPECRFRDIPSFVLFTYYMSRKVMWVHIFAKTCTDGIENGYKYTFWMTARSLFGHFRPERSIKALLCKVVRQGLVRRLALSCFSVRSPCQPRRCLKTCFPKPWLGNDGFPVGNYPYYKKAVTFFWLIVKQLCVILPDFKKIG